MEKEVETIDSCTYITGALWCIPEINSILLSNCTTNIKQNFFKTSTLCYLLRKKSSEAEEL